MSSLQEQADAIFLALCLWREARGEPREAKIGVAWSVMNRLASPSWGDSLMSVLFQRLQYSSLTYSSDPQLSVWPKDTDPSWHECLEIADGVLGAHIENPVGAADSYHDSSIQPPHWATPKSFIKQIGKLLFYKVGK